MGKDAAFFSRTGLLVLDYLPIAIEQFRPSVRFHIIQQGLIDLFAERTVLLQGDAHEIFIEHTADSL